MEDTRFAFPDMGGFAMATLEDLEHLPMTEFESALKTVLERRPDIQGKVLTAQELSDYITWMAESFGGSYHLKVGDVPSFAATADIAQLGRRLIEHPGDPIALQQLSAEYTEQREARYIAEGHDISVFRMFRYLPSHWHTNQYFEIYYAFSGDCPVYFKDEVVIAHPGTVLIVAPETLHASPCFADDCCLLYCMVRASTFEQVFWNQMPPENLMSTFFRKALDSAQSTSYVQFDTGEDQDVRHLMLTIYQEHQQAEAYSAQMLNVLMSAFFLTILRRHEGSARLPRTENFFWKHEFSAIFTYIQLHYAHTSVQEVADRFSYSQRQISRIVLNSTGKNFAQIITQLKMEKAASLLRQREFSTQAIADAVGYSTVSSFYRAFTAYYGCTPAQYAKADRST